MGRGVREAGAGKLWGVGNTQAGRCLLRTGYISWPRMRKEFLAFERGEKDYAIRGGSRQLLDKRFWNYRHTNCGLSLRIAHCCRRRMCWLEPAWRLTGWRKHSLMSRALPANATAKGTRGASFFLRHDLLMYPSGVSPSLGSPG